MLRWQPFRRKERAPCFLRIYCFEFCALPQNYYALCEILTTLCYLPNELQLPRSMLAYFTHGPCGSISPDSSHLGPRPPARLAPASVPSGDLAAQNNFA
ncbi:hypothetical protein EVAR_41531_1 [Eumeta japonica]|uniref:Uncharacterized protein n=1 Tax=Eumeta variegata TaxID=151549 RepID=A0A4C1X2E4_EUMVA|nr:hypothetical protein EVAR_41531_1 [Eumeta japonica]